MWSTHTVEQLSFSVISLILTFEFDLILGSFFTFWGPNGLYLGLEKDSITFLGSTHVVEQLSFSMLPSILTFDFDLFLGSFLTFCGPNGLFLGLGFPNGLFLGWVRVRQLFWGPLM